MKVEHLKNVLDYHWITHIIDDNASFQAYDKGDDCVMFTVFDGEGIDKPKVDISIYGYTQSFFAEENKVSDLLTEDSECIVISENYHDGGKIFVYNSKKDLT